MRKNWLLFGALVITLLTLVTACGIPKDQFLAMVAERDATKIELQSTNATLEKATTDLQSVKVQMESKSADLDKIKAELLAANGDLDKTKKELQSTKSDLSSARSRADAQQQTMRKAKAYADITGAIATVLTDPKANQISVFMSLTQGVMATEDPKLQSLYSDMLDSNGASKQSQDFFIYVWQTLPKVLQ